MKKVSERLLLLAVLGVILCPLLLFNFKSGQVSVVENRALAERASIHSHPDVFMKSIDDCVDDRIGFRDEMMGLYNKVIYKHLRGNHSNVIVGENGWLFYADDLPDYTGSNIDADRTEHQVAVVKAIDAWCKERGITFVLTVGPNKSTVYSEYMPDTICHEPYPSAERLIDRLREEGILVVYPKQELLDHKTERELYYRLDTHWNSFGAFYQLDQLIQLLGIKPTEIPVTETALHTGDLLTMLGIGEIDSVSVHGDVTSNPDASAVSYETDREVGWQSEDTVKIVCYRDSFTSALIDYYSYYFNGRINWTHVIDPQLVEREAPQVLMLSCVERYLGDAIRQNEQFLSLTGS